MATKDSKLACSPYLTHEMRSLEECRLEQARKLLKKLEGKLIQKVIAY